MKETNLTELKNEPVGEIVTGFFREWLALEDTEEATNRLLEQNKPENVKEFLHNVVSQGFRINNLTQAIAQAESLFTTEELAITKAYLYAQRGYQKEYGATHGELSKRPPNDPQRIFGFLSAAVDYMQHDIVGNYGPSQGMRIFCCFDHAGIGSLSQMALDKFWGTKIILIPRNDFNAIEQVLEAKT